MKGKGKFKVKDSRGLVFERMVYEAKMFFYSILFVRIQLKGKMHYFLVEQTSDAECDYVIAREMTFEEACYVEPWIMIQLSRRPICR